MSVVGLRGLWRKKGWLLPRYSTPGATVPQELFTGGGCEGERAAARVGGAGNAGRGASPTAGKRRDFLLISSLIRLIHLLFLYREV